MAYEKLINLVRKFDSGVIELPLMQRDYVWPAAKVVSLLDSLYRKWPIGIFYVWITPSHQFTRAAAVNRRIGAKIAEPFRGYLLDGHPCHAHEVASRRERRERCPRCPIS